MLLVARNEELPLNYHVDWCLLLKSAVSISVFTLGGGGGERGGEGLPYEKVGNVCGLAQGCKSRILVSLRVIRTKRHCFQLSKHLYDALEEITMKNALISIFRLNFLQSLKSCLPVRAPFLNSGW